MITQAAKAGIFNFFDTLRIELGSSIGGITIVTPAFIESEMLMGKYVSDKGETEWQEDQRDVSSFFYMPNNFQRYRYLLSIYIILYEYTIKLS